MPPRRPLPDLCLISVFKALTPNDQLKAAKMNPRCAILVRAANRLVKMLVITRLEGFDVENTKSHINFFSLKSKSSIQLLPTGGELFPDYPMTTTRLTKWNCLLVNKNQLLDLATVEQIVTAFPAITDLKLEKFHNASSENLIALLQRRQWINQLTSLVVFRFFDETDLPTNQRLIASINALSALQYLAMKWNIDSELPYLTILAQLKVIALSMYSSLSEVFLRSLESHAKDLVNLQVYLVGCCPTPSMLALSEPFRTRIIRYDYYNLSWHYRDVLRLCHLFPYLTTLSVACLKAHQLSAFFTAISQLLQLVHLELNLIWNSSNNKNQRNEEPFHRPIAQLTSVRALDLILVLRSHLQMQWMNLPVALPRLQTISICSFKCESCNVYLSDYLQGEYSEDSKPNTTTAFKCLRATLPLLYPGFPHSRIILGWVKPYPTLEQLLSTSHSSALACD